MPNTPEFLVHVLDRLEKAGLAPLVFGGWAEALLGLSAPRPHGDVDLLLPATSFTGLESALSARPEWREVRGKRFAHKRAFENEGVLVELTLVQDAAAGPVTFFWGDVPFHWLAPLAEATPVMIDGRTCAVASAANLVRYRQLHRATQPWRWRDPISAVD
jgi:hypothetical protein